VEILGADLEFWRKSIPKNFRWIHIILGKRAREKEKLMDSLEENFLLLDIVLPINF